jgi:hypothetical protein
MIDDHDAQIFARRLMNHFIAALQKKLLIPQRQMRGFARDFERALDHNGPSPRYGSGPSVADHKQRVHAALHLL